MTAPAPSPYEQSEIDRFGIFAEERVIEEVARAMWEDVVRDAGERGAWEDQNDRFIRQTYRRLAAAAVAAMRENEEKGARK